jgi:hypothetical protein
MVSGSEPRGGRWVPAGFGILARNQLARWFGVAVAAVNLIAALTSIEAYPFWALVIVGIDVLVIYGLAAYGDRLERPAGLSHEPHAPDLTQAIVVMPRSMGRHCRVGRRAGALVETIGPRRNSSLRRTLDPLRALATRRRAPRLAYSTSQVARVPAAGNSAILLLRRR